ncbi:hypothetical protein BAUCODRAFT_392479 [Baudoinia panamericana UAMH 10762]|uniref:Uncharacterized protein n=1 Tax=Baudoinia panamericana (strain UAMH 10762) TaxID=717646 RepID=M2LWT0_BAUPA|nr:uncharacterized protein BAUCODRAFT_392479 [Baudoinia panamericana UAMH 10762]EMC99127.1 hypothetical protein BAUCODRAFT_392479 [Baudoinia panamericana UAMH 10762]
MARVSFGSRAGIANDFTANGALGLRQSRVSGVYGSLPDLTFALKKEIAACTESELPELTTCELSIEENATLPLLRPTIGPYADGGEHDLPEEYKEVWTDGSEEFPGLTATLPKASITSILGVPKGQPRQIVQRAASRAIVQAIESADGFRYSFNNAWAAKDEGGLRYSYICQDSMQNKDRHANGFTKTQKHLKGEGERGPRKATYDCKGSISVKFSGSRRRVDVYYRHYAIHSTVAEQKSLPRPLPQRYPVIANPAASSYPATAPSRSTGGLYGHLQTENAAHGELPSTLPPSAPVRSESLSGRPSKRKRYEDGSVDPSRPLSLSELLQQSDTAKASIDHTEPEHAQHASGVPPPVQYNLPSWQAPPSAPPPPKPGPPQQRTQYNNVSGVAYPLPYQPQHYSQAQQYPQNPQMPVAKQSRQNSTAQAPGLFSTLKPVSQKKSSSGTHPSQFIMYQSYRAKTSCNNCRSIKKKVRDTTSPTINSMLTLFSVMKYARSAVVVQGLVRCSVFTTALQLLHRCTIRTTTACQMHKRHHSQQRLRSCSCQEATPRFKPTSIPIQCRATTRHRRVQLHRTRRHRLCRIRRLLRCCRLLSRRRYPKGKTVRIHGFPEGD